MKHVIITFMFLLTIICLSGQENAEQKLSAAIYEEEVNGDLEKAITDYKFIVEKYSNNRPVAAKALLHMGQCHQKLGNKEAKIAYNQLIREFSDQLEEVKKAQSLLAALKQPILKSNSSQLVFTRVWANAHDDQGEPSPDERYISFTNWDHGNLALYDTKTRKHWDITKDGIWGGELGDQFAMSEIWSPDGKKIAFSWWIDSLRGSELRTINADGTDLRILFKANNSWVDAWEWSPDGEKIIAEKGKRGGPHELVIVNAQDGTVIKLKTLMKTGYWGTNWRYCNASFSPDGKYILYNRSQNINEWNRRMPVKSDIYLMDLESYHEIKLIDHPAEDIMPFWSPDGKKIVFLSNRTGKFSLWAVSVENENTVGEPKSIIQNLEYSNILKLTRNGSLYYTKRIPRSGDIYTATMDMGTGKMLTQPKKIINGFEGYNTQPSWSPDGKYLAYSCLRGDQGRKIVVRTIENGEEHVLPQKNVLIHYKQIPVWTPDGESIVLLSNNPQDRREEYFVAINVLTEKESVFIRDYKKYGSSSQAPQIFSPDGKYFYFRSNKRLVKYNHVTGENKVLKDSIVHFKLSPDGKKMAYRQSDGKNIWYGILNVSDGTVINPLKDIFQLDIQLFTWTPDGKYLLYGK
ncbi:MAG: tetratricopeptide repeat protein, partial [Draconibacterium sp.]|nr:tetratricopeptide repeat protein [Draconibacterium sp.]